jgi:hypothetical protein
MKSREKVFIILYSLTNNLFGSNFSSVSYLNAFKLRIELQPIDDMSIFALKATSEQIKIFKDLLLDEKKHLDLFNQLSKVLIKLD